MACCGLHLRLFAFEGVGDTGGGNFGDEGQHRLALHLNNLNNRHYRASVDEMPATGRNFVVTFNTSL